MTAGIDTIRYVVRAPIPAPDNAIPADCVEDEQSGLSIKVRVPYVYRKIRVRKFGVSVRPKF